MGLVGGVGGGGNGTAKVDDLKGSKDMDPQN